MEASCTDPEIQKQNFISAEMERAKIPIPYQTGRHLLGVLDEKGELSYGEIFVQISLGTRKIIVKGKL